MVPPGCPNDDTLQRYVAGQLTEPARAVLNAHVTGCESCQRLLVELGRSESGLPERIEEFQLLKRLGRGAMGEVYLAKDTRLDRLVAIKFLGARGDEGRERLLREARAAARVHHPNLITVHRVAEHEGRPYLVCEYVDGQTLSELPRPLEAAVVLRIAVDLARGLAAAHREALLHRDIKPQNAMLARDGTAKLVDFGLAKSAGPTAPGAAPAGAAVDLTQSGAVVGTPRYLAPELWRGETATPQTDVYAFGVMLFELLSGRLPYGASTAGELRDEVLSTPAVSLRGAMPGLKPELCDLVDRCLQPEPSQRFASAAELSSALEGLASGPALQASAQGVPAPRRGSPGWPVSIAVLVLLGGAGTVLKLGTAERPSARSPVAEAAQAFDEGLAWWRSGSTTPAVRRLQAAVTRDASFAAAQLWLSFIQPDPVAARAAFSQAALHRGQLGDADGALLEALEPGQTPTPQLAEWAAHVDRLLAKRPADGVLTLLRARLHARSNELDAAFADFELAAERDPALRPPAVAAAAQLRFLTLVAPSISLAQYAQCLKIAPRSTDCLAGHARLSSRSGDCATMQQDARAWAGIDPKDPLAFETLANALYATGEPWPSVDEALRARDQAAGDAATARDSAALSAVARGDFVEGRALLQALYDEVPPSGGLMPHLEAAYELLLVLEETGDTEAGVALARGLLDRAKAWTPEAPHEIATTLIFAQYLRKQGAIDEAEFTQHRERWLAMTREAQQRTGVRVGAGHFAPWLFGWAAARTKEDAAVAVEARRGEGPLISPGVMNAAADLILVRVLLLAGRTDEAMPYLKTVAGTCDRLEQARVYAEAQWLLGGELEKAGDAAGARAAYQRVVDAWGKAKPRSVTADRARERLAALAL